MTAGLRERQRTAIRDGILAAATAEIAANGLAGCAIGRIATRAGVSRPTVYAHFPRREDFARALLARAAAESGDTVRKRLGNAGGAALLHRLTDALFDLLASADPVLRRECLAVWLREPDALAWTEHPFFDELAERVGVAQGQGEIAATLAPAQLLRLIVCALMGFLIVEGEGVAARRGAAHHTLDLVIAGAAG